MKKFNVITYDVNSKEFVTYDIIPHLVRCFNKKKKNSLKTFEEFKEFIRKEAFYQWWSRCEYEIILVDWPSQKTSEKWDVYKQVMMNIDIITKVFMDVVK